MQQLITRLEQFFAGVSEALPSLPKEFVAWLVKWAWLFSLIVGGLAILGAIGLFSEASSFSAFPFGGVLGAGGLSSSLYVAAGVAAVYGAVYLGAVRGLRQVAYQGWRLLFLGSLVQFVGVLVVAVLTGLGSITSFLEVVVGWYLIFQVRPAFVGDTADEEVE